MELLGILRVCRTSTAKPKATPTPKPLEGRGKGREGKKQLGLEEEKKKKKREKNEDGKTWPERNADEARWNRQTDSHSTYYILICPWHIGRYRECNRGC